MTVGIAFATPLYAGVLTDRRLTGTRVEEDSNKCGVVVYKNSRLAYTFAGLASVDSFTTDKWLAEALCDAGNGVPGLDGALDKFAAMATSTIEDLRKRSRITRKNCRLSVALAGFSTTPFGTLQGTLAIVSNYEGLDQACSNEASHKFQTSKVVVPSDMINAKAIGAVRSSAQVAPMVRLLANEDAPPTEAVESGISIIRSLSAAQPNGPVGDWCSSVLISRDSFQPALLEYHPGRVLNVSRLPTYVYAKYDDFGAFICQASIKAADAGGRPLQKAPRPPRGARCSCGSGKAFKKCHGRNPQPAKEMQASAEIVVKAMPKDSGVVLMSQTEDGFSIGPEVGGGTMRFGSGRPNLVRNRPRLPHAPSVD
jgi:hypothetical protein